MPSSFGSWLSGPPPVGSGPTDQRPNDYPGQRLGLPQDGPKSLARMGRRIGALLVDWLIAYGLAALLMSFGWISLQILSTAVLVIWLVIGAVSVRLFGFTPGQYALGLIVIPVDNRLHVGFGRALARGLLIALVVPPLFTDTDLRGIHDRLTNTAVVRR
ncbi:RDD family protein [Mycobacterium sp. ITM-2016-00318]|uniref:RDD family protein n=1 Tax=Mycobacterium sp. ITM-2016-00318 TaxID=2099693 RepID=UPI000CF90E86|nr:RDD family protein [Mycobacterium sp. ITM-2016-00318]WNG91076.1 RDD family protein [Mycobacterium sp. ITM-2016-00318]